MRPSRLLRTAKLIAGACCATCLPGCPQALSDDFRVQSVVGGAGGSSTSNSNAGQHNDAGTGFSYEDTGGTSGAPGMGGVATDTGGATDPGDASVGGGTEAGGAVQTGGANTGGILETGGSSIGTGGTTATGGTAPHTAACDWGSPVRAGLTVAGEQWSPNLSADALTLYFSTWDGQNNRIYSATRSAKNAAFGTPVRVSLSGSSSYTSPAQPQSPFLSHDGLTLYFVANSTQGTDKDIWTASRATATGSFGNAQTLASVNSTRDELRPWLSDDELVIYFASARSGGAGDFDIWTASRSTRSTPFSTPVNVESLNGAVRDSSPFLTSDMLTIYFTSSRVGGIGDRDIWRAERADIRNPFGAPTIVTSLDSAGLDSDVALSHDETELFYSSEASGTALVWRATLVCAENGS